MLRPTKQDDPYLAGPERPSRYRYGVPFVLHRSASIALSRMTGVSLEISEAGMSAIVRMGLRIGERIEVEIHLPSGDLRATAIVRGHTGKHYGFQFVDLSSDQLRQIASGCKLLEPYTGNVFGA